MGQKDVDPLFKLPRLPANAIKELAEELSEFELPARQQDAEVIDEFHSQASEICHRGRDHRCSISSDPPVIPQNFSSTSIAASSENSEDGLFQSFVQSPGSAGSSGSNPEQLFQDHFQVEDELVDEMLREPPAEDEEVTGSAANLIPEPEPEKTPEPREPEVDDITGSATNLIPEPEPEKTPEPRELETEVDVEPEGREINTPTRRQEEQETRREEEIPEKMNFPPPTDGQYSEH